MWMPREKNASKIRRVTYLTVDFFIVGSEKNP